MSSGLTPGERTEARRKLVRSSRLVHAERGNIHYSQGPRRWDGILLNRRAYKGDYPTQTDCSAMNSWQYFDALKTYINDGLPDIINGGKSWRDGGYTGTMMDMGKSVPGRKPTLVGDLVFYRGHVALYIGGGLVLSHGSEPGPYVLPWKYRSDVIDVRRYL